MKTLVTLLAPFAPHLTEELWEMLGGTSSVHREAWPTYDAAKLETSEVAYQVHVNGKMRAIITVSKEASEDEIKTISLAQDSVKQHVDGLTIMKHMIIPAKQIVIIIAK